MKTVGQYSTKIIFSRNFFLIFGFDDWCFLCKNAEKILLNNWSINFRNLKLFFLRAALLFIFLGPLHEGFIKIQSTAIELRQPSSIIFSKYNFLNYSFRVYVWIFLHRITDDAELWWKLHALLKILINDPHSQPGIRDVTD